MAERARECPELGPGAPGLLGARHCRGLRAELRACALTVSAPSRSRPAGVALGPRGAAREGGSAPSTPGHPPDTPRASPGTPPAIPGATFPGPRSSIPGHHLGTRPAPPSTPRARPKYPPAPLFSRSGLGVGRGPLPGPGVPRAALPSRGSQSGVAQGWECPCRRLAGAGAPGDGSARAACCPVLPSQLSLNPRKVEGWQVLNWEWDS